ncbi:insulinase family protein, partial [Burkholderia multivorans]
VGATKEQIRVLGHHPLLDHYASTYVPRRLIIAAAGGADHAEVVGMVERALAETGAFATTVARDAETTDRLGGAQILTPGTVGGGHPHAAASARTRPDFLTGRSHTAKDTEQLGMLLGCEGLPEGHPDRFVYSVLLTLLGGGMSSRLFQSIREERG